MFGRIHHKNQGNQRQKKWQPSAAISSKMKVSGGAHGTATATTSTSTEGRANAGTEAGTTTCTAKASNSSTTGITATSTCGTTSTTTSSGSTGQGCGVTTCSDTRLNHSGGGHTRNCSNCVNRRRSRVTRRGHGSSDAASVHTGIEHRTRNHAFRHISCLGCSSDRGCRLTRSNTLSNFSVDLGNSHARGESGSGQAGQRNAGGQGKFGQGLHGGLTRKSYGQRLSPRLHDSQVHLR